VRSLLDGYPNIECMIDLHSYSEDICIPGATTTTRARTEPELPESVFNGLRGTLGDAATTSTFAHLTSIGILDGWSDA